MYESKPKNVYDVVGEVMRDLQKRTDARRYTPEVIRETTMVKAEPMRKLDFEVGDMIQIKSGDCAGRIGRISGIRLAKTNQGNDILLYCIKFTNTDAVEFPAGRLHYLSSNTDETL